MRIRGRRDGGFMLYTILAFFLFGAFGVSSLSGITTASGVKSALSVAESIRAAGAAAGKRVPKRTSDGMLTDEAALWRGMHWAGEAVSMMAIIDGRTKSTLGLSNELYSASRRNDREVASMFSIMERNGVKTRPKTLAGMFRTAWRKDGAAVLVPSLADQFGIEYMSSHIMVFPEGASVARRFWEAAAANLVGGGSPLGFSDILW